MTGRRDRVRGDDPAVGSAVHAEGDELPRSGRPRSCLGCTLVALVLLCVVLALFGTQLRDLVQQYLTIIQSGAGAPTIDGAFAPLFTPEVDHWAADIRRWAAEYNLDPQLVATIIQIESCGDPRALSPAGAAGLLQVMPQHFAPGEDPFDPETNARRGLGILYECLTSNYNPRRDIGLAFACYNGGPSVFVTPWEYWPQQSRDYYTWGTGIYADALVHMTGSETLDRWLQAGGQELCLAARRTLGLAARP